VEKEEVQERNAKLEAENRMLLAQIDSLSNAFVEQARCLSIAENHVSSLLIDSFIIGKESIPDKNNLKLERYLDRLNRR
jgi:hypothetical protein